MICGNSVLGTTILRRGLAALCARSSSPGVAAQCLSTEASTDKSVPQDFVPPVAPPDTGGDGDPPDTGTIADGWFNADPVKITPTCPSSRVSLFWGRIVPERQDPPIHEEESINDQSEGLSKYLLGKHQRIDGKQPAPQDAPRDENIETTPVEASEEASIDFTPGLYTENPSNKLTEKDVGKFYMFERSLLPEAFPQYYKIEVPDDVPKREPRGGSKSLAKTFKVSDRDAVLARKSLYGLMNELSEDSGRIGRRMLVHGRPGSGKTFTLAALAEWGRKKHWLVMYVPSAMVFGQDLIFTERLDSHMFDTPNVAKDMLRSIRDSHREILEQEKQECDVSGTVIDTSALGTTLMDLCEIGISAQLPSVSVDACLKLLHEILFVKRSVPTMLIIDDYNALYWKTDYGAWVNEKHRRMVGIEEMILGNFMRLFEKDTMEGLHGCIIGAPTFSQGIRRNLWVPLGEKVTQNELDLLNREEITGLLSNMWNCGAIRPMEDSDVNKMIYLADGNGHDLRRALPILN